MIKRLVIAAGLVASTAVSGLALSSVHEVTFARETDLDRRIAPIEEATPGLAVTAPSFGPQADADPRESVEVAQATLTTEDDLPWLLYRDAQGRPVYMQAIPEEVAPDARPVTRVEPQQPAETATIEAPEPVAPTAAVQVAPRPAPVTAAVRPERPVATARTTTVRRTSVAPLRRPAQAAPERAVIRAASPASRVASPALIGVFR